MLNKLIITDEAIFDYEEIIAKKPIPKQEIKRELECYLDNYSPYLSYFRVKFYDENIDKMLLLFIYKGECLGIRQIWRLCGICEHKHWTEDMEDDGVIRNWLKSKL